MSIYSAGKLFAATGIRVGWAVGPSNLIKALSSFHQYNIFCMHGPMQLAVADSLTQSRENGFFDLQLDLYKK